jgi:small subunit ribosomal protein S11
MAIKKAIKNVIDKNKNQKIKKIPKSTFRLSSKLPYIVVITKTPNNIFLTATDFLGNTKVWESSGRCGFKGKSKTAYMAVVTTTEEFFKKVWHFGIRYIFLKTKGFLGPRKNLKKIIDITLKKFPFKFIGVEAKTSVAFNGCKKKKRKRK